MGNRKQGRRGFVVVTFFFMHAELFEVPLTGSVCWTSILASAESLYSVQAYGIHADFSLGSRVFQEIEDALQGYEIGILGMVSRMHSTKCITFNAKIFEPSTSLFICMLRYS